MKIDFRNDGILHVRVDDNVHIHEADVKNLHTQINEITQGKSYPMLFEYGEFNSFTDEALSLFARETPSKADALLLNDSFLLAAFANHYLETNDLKRPTKLFYKKEEAIQWLTQFID